jgi:MinD superfamily P-loop ATPase
MKQPVVLSGKGGTGKTTVASCFIRLSKNKAFADCDEEAPNLHQIFTKGEISDKKPYYGLKRAVKNDTVCIDCGKCEKLCRFGAIQNGKVNLYECESCGVCEASCPAKDESGRPFIRLKDRISGGTLLYHTTSGVFSTAELQLGSEVSGRLVSKVRARLYGAAKNESLAIPWRFPRYRLSGNRVHNRCQYGPYRRGADSIWNS